MSSHASERHSSSNHLESVDRMIFSNIHRDSRVTKVQIREEYEAPKNEVGSWSNDSLPQFEPVHKKLKASQFRLSH